MVEAGGPAVSEVWTCVRCKCTSETRLGEWFMRDRESSDGLCQDCIDAVLAEWISLNGEPERFIPRLVPGEFTPDDDDE